MVMVAAVGAAVKWFGNRRSDADDEVQGDDPIVRAMFKAVNEGSIDDFTKLVDDHCTIWVNSEQLARNGNTLIEGPELWDDAFRDLRTAYPDVRWELYDELTGKTRASRRLPSGTSRRSLSTATRTNTRSPASASSRTRS